MLLVKLSRLYFVLGMFCLCVDHPWQAAAVTRTLCDAEICTCHDPYGRVLCSCAGSNATKEVLLRRTGDYVVPLESSAIIIRDCAKVTVGQGALQGLKGLRLIELTNIKQLVVQSYGFRWQENGTVLDDMDDFGVRVNLTKVTVEDLPSYTFAGRIREVVLDGCYIGIIRSFAFSSLERTHKVLLRNTNVANAEAQAFKKFSTDKFLIVQSRFNVIPSRFFTDMYVNNVFKIDSSFINEVRTLAFNVLNPIVTVITTSRVNVIQSEAFRVRTRGAITLEHNVFDRIDDDAFRALSVEKHIQQLQGRQKLRFYNNTVGSFAAKSFLFNDTLFEVVLGMIALDESCSCDGLETWQQMVPSVDTEHSPFWCRTDSRKEADFEYISGDTFLDQHCKTLLSSIYFFVVIISATVVGLLLVILVLACYMKRRKKWKSVPTAGQGSEQKPRAKKSKEKHREAAAVVKPETGNGIIIPDGRTYRETEFHVIVEKAEPLEEMVIPYRVTRDRSRSQVREDGLAR